MKIGIFIDDYLPAVHGVATSTVNLRQALEALGHEVYIVAPKCEGYDDHDDHVIRLPSAKNYVFDKRETAVIYPGLAKKLDDYQFDIVHSQMQFYMGALAHIVAKRQRIPHVTTPSPLSFGRSRSCQLPRANSSMVWVRVQSARCSRVRGGVLLRRLPTSAMLAYHRRSTWPKY